MKSLTQVERLQKLLGSSISHGTLLIKVLVEETKGTLGYLDSFHPLLDKEPVIPTYSDMTFSEESEILAEYLADMIDAINHIMFIHGIDTHYFGMHEGDGSDLGFWPVEDTL